ncbi:hypothetical protein KAU11_09130 [Candidatus Babeliales bacterium]|nr:hypothetical protein [Candidatus Babeliales bacterium]
MNILPIDQQIKIIKAARLKIPVYRAPSEDYDIDAPVKFDKHIHREDILINNTINFLLSQIRYLSKELLTTDKAIPKDVWNNLKIIRKMLESQRHTQL